MNSQQRAAIKAHDKYDHQVTRLPNGTIWCHDCIGTTPRTGTPLWVPRAKAEKRRDWVQCFVWSVPLAALGDWVVWMGVR